MKKTTVLTIAMATLRAPSVWLPHPRMRDARLSPGGGSIDVGLPGGGSSLMAPPGRRLAQDRVVQVREPLRPQ